MTTIFERDVWVATYGAAYAAAGAYPPMDDDHRRRVANAACAVADEAVRGLDLLTEDVRLRPLSRGREG